MKIGIDCRIYSSKYTGIGRYVYELVHRVSKLDKKNEYVLFFNQPEFSNFDPPAKNVTKVLAESPIYSIKEQFKFLSVLNKQKLDLMHFTHFNKPIFYRRPSVVTIHDLTLSFYPGKKKKSIFHRLGYHLTFRNSVKKATKVITVSENSKKDLMKLVGTPEEKIQVIYQGVGKEFKIINDKDRINRTLKKYGIKSPFLLYTGVWRYHKNIPNLIKALKELREEYNVNDLSLVITGKEDPYYPEVLQAVEKLKLSNNVIFTGLVNEEELIDLYNEAMIYTFPSLYEGFGLPILEAMACGTPVAASDVSSIPEICGKGNAVFFNPEEVKDIAQKINSLYSNEDMRDKLIAHGLRRKEEFSWDKMAKQTHNIYEECLNN